jgi:hypothetical protein
LLIIGTSSDTNFLRDLEISNIFKYSFKVPRLVNTDEIELVFNQLKVQIRDNKNKSDIFSLIAEAGLGIGTLYQIIEDANISTQNNDNININNNTGNNNNNTSKYLVSLESVTQALNRLNREF